jgi:hypothetical protein
MVKGKKRWVNPSPVIAASLFLVFSGTLPARGAACVGDCDVDGAVTVDEILRGVDIALGRSPVDRCPAFDGSDDGEVTVDEIVAAVENALNGCALTPTPTPSATVTPTPTTNRPPVLAPEAVYRTFPGYPVEFAVHAVDPEGDEVRCQSSALPAGTGVRAVDLR